MASWILALSGAREHTTAKTQNRKRNTDDRQPRTLSNWMMHKAKILRELKRETQKPTLRILLCRGLQRKESLPLY